MSLQGPDLSVTYFCTSVVFVVARIMHFLSNWDLLESHQPFSSFPSVMLCLYSLLLANSFLSHLYLLPLAVSMKQSWLAIGKGRSSGHPFPNAQHLYSWGALTGWTYHAKPQSSQFWLSNSPHLCRSVHWYAEVLRRRTFQDQTWAACVFSLPTPSSLNP